MQLLEELVSELQLTDPVSSGVTHMDNPPYYRITSSYTKRVIVYCLKSDFYPRGQERALAIGE